MESLIRILSEYMPVKKTLANAILKYARCIELEPDEAICGLSKRPEAIYFVEKGLLITYTLANQVLMCDGLKTGGQVFLKGPFFSDPGKEKENIVALENSIVYTLSIAACKTLRLRFREFNSYMRIMKVHEIGENIKRMEVVFQMRLKKRYSRFVQTYPEIHNRIPMIWVSCFLAIPEKKLLRIKRDHEKEIKK